MPFPDNLPSAVRSGNALSPVIEVKRTLAGGEKYFSCRVLWRQGTHLIVLFVAPAAMNVHGVKLPAGTVTFGHFWSDRPYNVYHWLDQRSGATLGYYLNLSDSTHFSGERLEWLDLTVDILVVPPQAALVLDEDEIPADISADMRARIDHAKATALAELPATVLGLEQHRASLWPVAREACMEEGDS